MINEFENINNELKGYINEATFIGDKYRNKLIKLINKYFYVELPIDNYLRVDIIILENGNIIMRDIEYQTNNKPSNNKEVLSRYNMFKEEIEKILTKNEINFEDIGNKNNIKNLIIVILLTQIIVIVGIYSLFELLLGNLFGFIWFICVIGYNFIPKLGEELRDRYKRAFAFIKKLLKK